MEVFILKLIGILCVTIISMAIIITRRNDIEVCAIVVSLIFELVGLFIIYMPFQEIILLIQSNI